MKRDRQAPEPLAAKPHPGRTPGLRAAQLERLEELLLVGAKKHGWRTELGTADRVAVLVDGNGNLIDGNRDGIAGGNYVAWFGVAANATVSAHAFDELMVDGALPRIRTQNPLTRRGRLVGSR